MSIIAFIKKLVKPRSYPLPSRMEAKKRANIFIVTLWDFGGKKKESRINGFGEPKEK